MSEIKDDIVVGLMFGDEGKGTTVDFLSTENKPSSVVRFSGGAQAAHNVVLQDGTHHTFAQFGAASLRGIPTTLSRFMIVNPTTLVEEGDLIFKKSGWNPFPALNISEKSLVTSPIHAWINRRREEARGAEAHGSCGMGVGETRYYSLEFPENALTMKDLEYSSEAALIYKLENLVSFAEEETGLTYDGVPVSTIVDSYMKLRDANFLNIVPDRKITQIISRGYHIFEGSQGVLLDEWNGFHPYTTWSETTSTNAQRLLSEAGKPAGKVIGVTRSYLTRHGYGPFPSEINENEAEKAFPEAHNTYGEYQGAWRAGWFDPFLFRYAVEANFGVDALSITHMDRVRSGGKVVSDYKGGFPDIPSGFFGEDMEAKETITRKLLSLSPSVVETVEERELVELISEIAEVGEIIVSEGPTAEHKSRV